jgi:hypothetical protein
MSTKSRYYMGRLLAAFALVVIYLSVVPGTLAQEETTIIFLHHSCGHNLIEQGGVRERLSARGYAFYDHGYNGDGLRLADGTYTGTHFDVPGDNTDPDGLAEIFSQPLHDPPDNTFSHLMQYDMIAFKSCFPTSNIYDDEQLASYQSYYLTIRDRIDQHPEKLFVVVTQPPQVPANSVPDEGERARTLANWLQSDEYLAGHPNLFVFDFFGHLAGDDNFLRPEYRMDEYDAHPNEQANRDIGPLFVEFFDQSIQSYLSGVPRPELVEQPSTSQGESSAPAAPETVAEEGAQIIEPFETTQVWDATSDSPDSIVECGVDSGFPHGGSASLRLHYEVRADGWADCGYVYSSAQDWSGSNGLGLWVLAEEAGQQVNFLVFAGDPEAAIPYQVTLRPPAESAEGWEPMAVPWADFEVAHWADSNEPLETNLSQVTGYDFNFPGGSDGVLWIDDLYLIYGVIKPPDSASGEEEPPAGAEADEPPSGDSEEPLTAQEEAPEEPAEAESGGGICPLGAALPLGLAAIGLVFAARHR